MYKIAQQAKYRIFGVDELYKICDGWNVRNQPISFGVWTWILQNLRCENLWQWFLLETRLNTSLRSTIPRKEKEAKEFVNSPNTYDGAFPTNFASGEIIKTKTRTYRKVFIWWKFLEVVLPHHLIYDSFKNSRPDVFCETNVLKDYAKFTGKHLCRLRAWHYEKRQVFYKIFKSRFVTEHIWATVYVVWSSVIVAVSYRVSRLTITKFLPLIMEL